MVKNCDRGLENAARGRSAEGSTFKPEVTVFTIRTGPKPANNMFIFFFFSKLVLQITNEFLYATLSY